MSVDRLLGRVRVADGTLQPFDPVSYREAALHWSKGTAWVRLEDEERVRTNAQNRYWWSVVVPAIGECWQHEKGWSAPPAKKVVHGALVKAVFGTVDTPLGPERRSSGDLTVQQFTELIDWTRSYAWERYQVRIPEASEVME